MCISRAVVYSLGMVSKGKARVIVTVPKAMLEKLRELAKRDDRSVSYICARLIRQALGL